MLGLLLLMVSLTPKVEAVEPGAPVSLCATAEEIAMQRPPHARGAEAAASRLGNLRGPETDREEA